MEVSGPWCPLDRRLGEPQGLSGCYGEGKNILPMSGIEPQFLSRPAHILCLLMKPSIAGWCTMLCRKDVKRKVLVFLGSENEDLHRLISLKWL
jgi:hypothetical protein